MNTWARLKRWILFSAPAVWAADFGCAVRTRQVDVIWADLDRSHWVPTADRAEARTPAERAA